MNTGNLRCKFNVTNYIVIIAGRDLERPEAAVFKCSSKYVFLNFFSKFTGKHPCWSLFLMKLQGFRPATLF